MANITATGALTAVADGPGIDYTVKLTNSTASSAAIGTFWFAWVPGEDFLASSPSLGHAAGRMDRRNHPRWRGRWLCDSIRLEQLDL